MGIGDEKYARLTTFTKAGTEKHTPVWIVNMSDGRVGFYTEAGSWKVRRITNDPTVRLQACDMRGRVTPGSEAVKGTAEVLNEGNPAFLEIRRLIDTKYGFTAKVLKMQTRVAGLFKRSEPERCAVAIRID